MFCGVGVGVLVRFMLGWLVRVGFMRLLGHWASPFLRLLALALLQKMCRVAGRMVQLAASALADRSRS
jgi:hypothetical protein